jgi:hypothetical protein
MVEGGAWNESPNLVPKREPIRGEIFFIERPGDEHGNIGVWATNHPIGLCVSNDTPYPVCSGIHEGDTIRYTGGPIKACLLGCRRKWQFMHQVAGPTRSLSYEEWRALLKTSYAEEDDKDHGG